MAKIMFEQSLTAQEACRTVLDELLETERDTENRIALLSPTLHTSADGSQAHPVPMVLD